MKQNDKPNSAYRKMQHNKTILYSAKLQANYIFDYLKSNFSFIIRCDKRKVDNAEDM